MRIVNMFDFEFIGPLTIENRCKQLLSDKKLFVKKWIDEMLKADKFANEINDLQEEIKGLQFFCDVKQEKLDKIMDLANTRAA